MIESKHMVHNKKKDSDIEISNWILIWTYLGDT